jgi:hypothetical protein
MRASEYPNPLTPCRDYQLPTGLPIMLQLVTAENISSYSITDLTASRELETCAFDSETYDNPDAAQQAYGRRALSAARAIIMIPRYPLRTGHRYRVKIQTSAVYEWTFEVAGAGDELTAQRSARSAAPP